MNILQSKLIEYINQELKTTVNLDEVQLSEFQKLIINKDICLKEIKKARQIFDDHGQLTNFSKKFIANLKQLIDNKIKLNDHLKAENLNIELADCINDELIMNYLEVWNKVMQIQNNSQLLNNDNRYQLDCLKVFNNAFHFNMKLNQNKSQNGQQNPIIESKHSEESDEQLYDESNLLDQSDEQFDSCEEDEYENIQKQQFIGQLSK